MLILELIGQSGCYVGGGLGVFFMVVGGEGGGGSFFIFYFSDSTPPVHKFSQSLMVEMVVLVAGVRVWKGQLGKLGF